MLARVEGGDDRATDRIIWRNGEFSVMMAPVCHNMSPAHHGAAGAMSCEIQDQNNEKINNTEHYLELTNSPFVGPQLLLNMFRCS